jgi:carbon starvation protein CstA
MITEGIVALIWATVASYFFFDGGHEALGAPKGLATSAPEVVTIVADGWLGKFGAVLALLGVVAAPITSGDTALRSARLIIADVTKLAQKTIKSRLLICVPLFALTMLVLWFNIADKDGFNVIWSYFGWANQTLSVFTLWTITVFLALSKKPYIITMIPAVFMTGVCTTFLFISKNSLGSLEVFSNPVIGYAVGAVSMVCSVALFAMWLRKQK